MAKAVRQTTDIDVRIKWPNDLVADNRKLGGIIVESSIDLDRIGYIVVGLGLNVHKNAYPPELKGHAVSIEELMAEKPPLRRDILVNFLAAMEERMERLETSGFPGIAEEYRALSCTLGSEVRVFGSVELTGVAEDISDTGALLVRTADGEPHWVMYGDVSVRGMMGYV